MRFWKQKLMYLFFLVGWTMPPIIGWGFVTNYWSTNVVGNFDGILNAPDNWSRLEVPQSDDQVWFTNRQAAPYTVQITNSMATGPLRIYDDTLILDLNGYRWTVNHAGRKVNPSTDIRTLTENYATVVRISSTSDLQDDEGNWLWLEGSNQNYDWIQDAPTRLIVDDSLGYPVKVRFPFGYGGNYNATIVVSGEGAEFVHRYHNSTYSGGIIGPVLVTSNGTYRSYNSHHQYIGGRYRNGYMTVEEGGRFYTHGDLVVGPYWGLGEVTLRKGGAWTADSYVFVGYSPYLSGIMVDNSEFVGTSMELGRGSYEANGASRGFLTITNQSTASFSQFLLINKGNKPASISTLNLHDSCLRLGGIDGGGGLTNRGIMAASGMIQGVGDQPAVICNENTLEFGADMGQLSISNAFVQLEPNSITRFRFDETQCDRLHVVEGAVSVRGKIEFALGEDALPLEKRYGRESYRFMVADSIDWTPESETLTALMEANNLFEHAHYTLRVVGMPDGREALRLRFFTPGTAIMLR